MYLYIERVNVKAKFSISHIYMMFGHALMTLAVTPVSSFTCIHIYTIIDVGPERAGKFLFQVSTVAQRKQTAHNMNFWWT